MLIFEPKHTGHRFSLYVKLLLDEAMRQGIRVNLITSTEAYRSKICQEFITDYKSILKVTTFRMLKYKVVEAFVLIYLLLKKPNGERFVVLTLDPRIWFILLCNLVSAKNIVSVHLKTFRLLKKMYPKFYSRWFARVCYWHVYKYRNKIYSIDPTAVRLITRILGHRVVDHLNDPVDTLGVSECVLRELSYRNENDLLVYGSINKTKAANKAVELANLTNLSLIVAGKQSDEIKADLNEINSNAIFIDRFLDQKELVALISNSKIIWLAYEDNESGSSGVLHTAVYFKKKFLIQKPSRYVKYFCKVNEAKIEKYDNYFLVEIDLPTADLISRNRSFQKTLVC